MDEIMAFVEEQNTPQRDILLFLHTYLTAQPDIQPKIRYKIPFYFRKSWVCYLNNVKNNGVELAFIRGRELADEGGILSANGRKMVKGITFHSVRDISIEKIDLILQEALLLDDTMPYKIK